MEDKVIPFAELNQTYEFQDEAAQRSNLREHSRDPKNSYGSFNSGKGIIKFRPHHFMCTLGFRGKGYSLDFVRNYKNIANTLKQDENTLLEVAEYMDDICTPCPNKIDEIVCKSQEKILRLDKAHSEVLKLKPGEVMSWKDAKARIKNNMTLEKFDKACEGCDWKKYGVCEESLKELLNS
jgi:hypothetical protein